MQGQTKLINHCYAPNTWLYKARGTRPNVLGMYLVSLTYLCRHSYILRLLNLILELRKCIPLNQHSCVPASRLLYHHGKGHRTGAPQYQHLHKGRDKSKINRLRFMNNINYCSSSSFIVDFCI